MSDKRELLEDAGPPMPESGEGGWTVAYRCRACSQVKVYVEGDGPVQIANICEHASTEGRSFDISWTRTVVASADFIGWLDAEREKETS